jgi:hypothetical protein
MNHSDINNIHFRYINSMLFYEVDIKIMIEIEPLVIVKAFFGYKNSDIDNTFKISLKQFGELKDIINTLNKANIEDKTMGLDGSDWVLEYDINEKTKTYEFWSPEVNTKERKLEEFMSVCKQIMKIAKLDPNSIIDK